ncbi:MAG TPA: S41 family peptidase [Pyrinomonadaceae bacterium]|nr:S41 family peptidase [Pyrinomonadaceae bacterium]
MSAENLAGLKKMKNILLAFIAILLGLITISGQTIAFKNVNVIPMNKEQILLNQTVLFHKTSISEKSKNAQANDDAPIDAKTCLEVIDKTIKLVNDNYVFPEIAKQIETSLRKKIQNGECNKTTSSIEFAKILTNYLQEINHDKHFAVEFSQESISEPTDSTPTPEAAKKRREKLRQDLAYGNYGFRKVERLSGNIGYLELTEFVNAEFGGETVASAMNFLHDTNALIIDLRDNDGGRPDMIALLTSYFFEGGAIQLTGIFSRSINQIRESWTSPFVSGKKYLDKDIYILTSNQTISAAEAFTYNLKLLKRATIIGETTAGAANPGAIFRVNEHFSVFIPTGRAVNPLTNTNWEGIGITPDIKVSAAEALKVAHITALEKVLEKSSDETFKKNIKELIEKLKNQPVQQHSN